VRKKKTRDSPTRVTGIYRDKIGYRVVTNVGGTQRERRYAPESDLGNLIIARQTWIKERRHGVITKQTQTFAPATVEFLNTFKGRRLVDVTIAINHWLTVFKELAIEEITPEKIATQMSAWDVAGVANSTRRHRRRELANFFTWKFGIGGINPVRAVPRPPKTRRERPRDFPYVVARLILFQMPNRGKRIKGQQYKDGEQSLSKMRLRVMLETGWPHVVIQRLTKADLHLAARQVYIVPRRKGKGVKGRMMPITRRAAAALRAFAAANAFGPFSASSMRTSFLLAVEKAKAIWEAHARETPQPWPAPDDLHPYDIRHAFIARTVRQHGIEAAHYLAIHADIRQTMEYDVDQALYDLAVNAVKD